MLLAQTHEAADGIVGLVITGVLAIILLGLLIWGVKKPVVWRLLSVFGMAVGSGVFVWGIMAAAMGVMPSSGSPPVIIGVGAGVLVGAISLLVISFLGGKPGEG